ncbi:class I adenylate-forming enzyme family protein [Brevundimonas sp. VNH65]|uniref:class I adenylate-forming enzyme family protein n=1 Tax=Brevundimonas sp. VNH65 TaxID=3400917 RepID=UPI001D5957C6|nr:acyl--CoA ligase [Alphaproteobacteria bacterium]
MPNPVLSATPGSWPAMSLAEANARVTAPGMPCEMIEVLVEGRPTRVWKHAPPSLGAVLTQSRLYGDRIALVHEDESVSFEAHWRAAMAFAAALRAAGVVKGDRVAIIMRNLPEWSVAFYAAASLGAVVAPLNAWWTGPELVFAIRDSGAKVIVFDGERYARSGADLMACPGVERAFVARPVAPLADTGAVDLAAIIGSPETWGDLPEHGESLAEVDPEDDATLFYTSGTTGRPKGVLASQRAVNSNIITALSTIQRGYFRRGETPPPTGLAAPQYSGLISVPFFHVTGCLAILNLAMYGGSKLAMMRKWDPVRAFELIERERLASAGGVPTIAWQLIEHPARRDYDLSSLVSLGWGGAPSAPELVRRIREVFPQTRASQGWGMTETSATFTSNADEDFEARPTSCGPASPVGRIRIIDPADGVTEKAIGEVGELWVSGPMCARRYWNNPEATAQTFIDGWVRTGDLARLDEEGFCYIVDRLKDMLIRGGENIFCIEVENVLYEHPAVMDAAVFGVPHLTLGEEPAAAVTLKPGAHTSENDLLAFAANRLAAYKRPVRVLVAGAPLPRNPNGKILKDQLRAMLVTDRPGPVGPVSGLDFLAERDDESG